MVSKIDIMGILNVTPDSFSDGGKYTKMDDALFRVEEMIQEGASIIDIGGESTRPGSNRISYEEECSRVLPAVKMIKERFDVKVSVDTYKAGVAYEVLKLGADMINDISGFEMDPEMIDTIAPFDPVCIVMHMKGTPENMQQNPFYNDVVVEVKGYLKGRVNILKDRGLSKIIVDPGFGFGKTLDDNYRLLKGIESFKDIGCPILAGMSRKSMIGNIVSSTPAERVSGTIALHSIAILNGASIIRVHDVKEAYQSVKIIEKYLSV